MEIQQILIFAILGAVILVVVAGGASAMMDTDADTTTLAAGGAVGAGLGAAASLVFSSGGSVQDVMDTVLLAGSGSGNSEMRVGLPAF